MAYVDGYVLVVPRKNVKAYRKMALMGKRTWMKHGALDYKECVGDDLASQWGVPFTKLMKTSPRETVVFAWVIFKSRAHRNKVNAAVMKELSAKSFDPKDMPMDPNRMSVGGFKVIVQT